MKILFHDSFKKSLKRIHKENTFIFKLYFLFRYDIINFFKNIYLFRKDLWNFRWWDYHFILSMLQTGLKKMERNMHNGLEIPELRNKKIAKMQRAIEILNHIQKAEWYEIAEKELKMKYIYFNLEFELVEENPNLYTLKSQKEYIKQNNSIIHNRANELEQLEWNELWDIFKGQDINEFVAIRKSETEKEKNNDKLYNDWFDGSNMQGWWD